MPDAPLDEVAVEAAAKALYLSTHGQRAEKEWPKWREVYGPLSTFHERAEVAIRAYLSETGLGKYPNLGKLADGALDEVDRLGQENERLQGRLAHIFRLVELSPDPERVQLEHIRNIARAAAPSVEGAERGPDDQGALV